MLEELDLGSSCLLNKLGSIVELMSRPTAENCSRSKHLNFSYSDLDIIVPAASDNESSLLE